jgi:hypothetical protein
MFSWKRHFIFFDIGRKWSWREAVWSVLGNEGEGGGHAVFFCITKPWSSSREGHTVCIENFEHSGTKAARPP